MILIYPSFQDVLSVFSQLPLIITLFPFCVLITIFALLVRLHSFFFKLIALICFYFQIT